MDIMLSLVDLTDTQHQNYVNEIKKSNLPKKTQWDLIDLLQTVLEQTNQAKGLAWL